MTVVSWCHRHIQNQRFSTVLSSTRLFAKMKILISLAVIWVTVATATTQGACHSTPQVAARVGDDVILQCRFDAPLNLSTRTSDWRRDKQVVHVYRNRMDYPDAQDPQFKGRTALSHEDLSSGVMTLQIVSVQLGDSGIYSCNVPNVGDSVLSQCVMLTVTNTTEVRPTTTRSQEEDERTKSEVDNTVGAVVWVCVLVGVLVGAGLLFLVKWRKSLRCWRKVRKAPAVEGANICHMQTLMKPSGAGDQNQDVTQITLSNK